MKWSKVTVFCFIACVVKCTGMSKSEIEDFADYLEKTSKLDVILKKGNPDQDYDDEDEISDHAWEDSGKFEGDLILNDRQRKLLVEDVAEGLARNGLQDSSKRWPNNEVIYYIQREHFNSDQVDAIMTGIEDLEQSSCIKFRPYKKGDRDAVVIQGSRRGCFSQVGYQGGYQVLNLSHRHPVGRGCFRHGTVVHELLHSLGFYHMQSSPDRDDYIDVLWENIIQPARHNFRKYNSFSVSDFGVGYDYDSVLHYSRRAFSSNGKDTLVPKQSGASIGQRTGLSDKDVKKLNKMYCDADSDAPAAEEEKEQKQKPTKKKKPKSKPFEGHGIGYHQGKTVVIKLNPEAKTYKITKTIPRYHVFDRFSKASEALSPATHFEGIGPAKEIKSDYTPEFNDEDFEKPIQTTSNSNNFTSEKLPVNYVITDLNKSKNDQNANDKVKTEAQPTDENTEADELKVDENINTAIDRLGKIIKTHVYPSQTPDFEVYKIKPDHTEYYYNPTETLNDKKHAVGKPEEKHDRNDDSEDTEISSYYENISKPSLHQNEKEIILSFYKQLPSNDGSEEESSKEEDAINGYKHPFYGNKNSYNIDEDDSSYITKSPFYNQYNDSDETDLRHVYAGLREVGDDTPHRKEDTITDEPSAKIVESSYRTSYPFQRLNKVKEELFKTPHYATREYLKDKDDYSSYYNPKENNDHNTNGKYKILGQPTPLQHAYYEINENKNVNDKYNVSSYTKPAPNEKSSPLEKLQLVSDSKGIQIHGKLPSGNEAYHLFGVLVPVTQDWYKVDYDPQRGAYSIEKNKSNKDNT